MDLRNFKMILNIKKKKTPKFSQTKTNSKSIH